MAPTSWTCSEISMVVHALVVSNMGDDRRGGSWPECVCATVWRAGAADRPRELAAASQLLRPGECLTGCGHPRNWSRRLFCRLKPGSTARRTVRARLLLRSRRRRLERPRPSSPQDAAAGLGTAHA